MKISRPQLLREIRERDGNLSEIARAYGLTYNAVHKRVQGDPELSAAMLESREALVDQAQAKLGEAVRSGSAWAVKFVLETWGKSRGFTKQLEVVEQPTAKPQVVLYLPDNGRRRTI
ncbi:MAG: hypothetical protein KGQ51_13760 [Planctomycetes bacterium]|nr:hypothetical protein [Planctomycetota bacterium]